jgi:hypothetical protein
MEKLSSAEGFFDDGLTYQFTTETSQPKHIRFKALTTNNQLESCDVRLTTLVPEEPAVVEPNAPPAAEEPQAAGVGPANTPITQSPLGPAGFERKLDSDALFFRAGYFNYLKVNSESMIHKSEPNTWYQIDLLLDWDLQNVSVYVDGVGKSAEPFFVARKTVLESVNAVAIYNLSPGSTCNFKELEICDTDLCANSK